MTTWLEGLSYAFMGSKFPDWSVGNQVTIREYMTDTGMASSPVAEFYKKVVRKTAEIGYFDRSVSKPIYDDMARGAILCLYGVKVSRLERGKPNYHQRIHDRYRHSQ